MENTRIIIRKRECREHINKMQYDREHGEQIRKYNTKKRKQRTQEEIKYKKQKRDRRAHEELIRKREDREQMKNAIRKRELENT